VRMFKTKGSYGIFGNQPHPGGAKAHEPHSAIEHKESAKSVAVQRSASEPKIADRLGANDPDKKADKIVAKGGPQSAKAKAAAYQQRVEAAVPVEKKVEKSSSGGLKMKFGGGEKCTKCGQTAYPEEAQTYDNRLYHKTCFKCLTCKSNIPITNVAVYQGDLYCKNCFTRMFKTKGSYGIFNASEVVSPVSPASPSDDDASLHESEDQDRREREQKEREQKEREQKEREEAERKEKEEREQKEREERERGEREREEREREREREQREREEREREREKERTEREEREQQEREQQQREQQEREQEEREQEREREREQQEREEKEREETARREREERALQEGAEESSGVSPDSEAPAANVAVAEEDYSLL